MKDFYDCLVIGGGPAGSTVAALVAQSGFSTLLIRGVPSASLDVGQSLMPESRRTLARLGLLDQMNDRRFLPCGGIQILDHAGQTSLSLRYGEANDAQGWQIQRTDFDGMLLANAAALGAQIDEQSQAREMLLAEERVVGVRLETAAGAVRDVAARVVVVASLQLPIPAKQLERREAETTIRPAAIWGSYRGARRESGPMAGATLILHTRHRNSWCWFIPLADDVTSIGVVGNYDDLRACQGKTAEVFEDELVQCPALAERLTGARLISTLHVSREAPSPVREHAGDGWVLVGDALWIADPVFSAGVFLALKSAELAADAIVEGLKYGDTSGKQLGRWCPEFLLGAQRMRRLTDAFYSRDFDFGRFLEDHPQHQSALARLLRGGLFDAGSEPLLADLDRHLAAPQVRHSLAPRAAPVTG